MRVLLFAVSILSAWRWGDWRNWKKYYPTILFFILCSFYYVAVYHNYPLWKFEQLQPFARILSNNILIAIPVSFIVFPCTALIYLGHYPAGLKQVLYVSLWVAIYTLIETVMLFQGAITYHNGWNLIWSIVFDIILFVTIRLHYLRPWLGWVAVIVFSVFFGLVFGFPTNQ